MPIPHPLIPLDRTLIAQIIREKVRVSLERSGDRWTNVELLGTDEAADAIAALVERGQQAMELKPAAAPGATLHTLFAASRPPGLKRIGTALDGVPIYEGPAPDKNPA